MPNELEYIDGIGIFRADGSQTFRQAVGSVSDAIAKAREQGISKLMIVATGLTGFSPPSPSERHWMVREWVQASRGSLIFAVVAPEAYIDEERFGIVAAANFGVSAEVFISEPEAMEWLGNNR